MSKSLELIVADLLRETSSWDSIDVQLAVTQTVHQQIGKKPPRTSSRREYFAETSQGQKVYRCVMDDQGGENVIWLGYCDGARCAYVDYDKPPRHDRQHAITVTKTFMDEQITGYSMRPEPLRFHFVGRVPLHEAVQKASRVGSGRFLGRECELMLFSAVPGTSGTQELMYHLDSATSVPLKVQAFANQDRLEASNPSWIWEATSFDELQGFHVALNSRYTGFMIDGTGNSSKQLTNEYKMTSLAFNKKHEASEFWPSYDKGVRINDLIAHKSYYNTPDKKAPPSATAKTAPASVTAIAATDPADYTSWLAGGGFILGCALLGASLHMWIKRR